MLSAILPKTLGDIAMLQMGFHLDISGLENDVFGLMSSKFVSLAGVKGSKPRPMIDRVVANTVNFCAHSAQEAIVDRIGREYNIREKRGMGRFPSFIQSQVKITQFANAGEGSPYVAELTAAPFSEEAKANRPNAIPLILDILEEGSYRLPFIGKNVAFPNSKTTREGGTFRGKVRREYEWESLGISKIEGERKRSRGERKRGSRYELLRGEKGRGIFMIRPKEGKGNGAKHLVFQRVKGMKKPNLLYSTWKKGSPITKQKDSLHFVSLAEETINRVVERHFLDLADKLGDGRSLTGQFKYYENAVWMK